MPAIRPSAHAAAITGWGTYLPPKVVTNADLEATMDTSDQWIVERTGISSRHVGGSTAELSVQSAQQALEMAGLDPTEIDALVLATTTPDRAVPATASSVQRELGLQCGAFDVNAACSGFVYSMVVAHGLIAAGSNKILLVGTDTLSRITDWQDRNTAVLFADGSGAVVIEATEGDNSLLSWNLESDGSAEEFLYCDIGDKLQMEGREVFRRAVRIMVDSAMMSMKEAGVTADDISLVVPHQANIRIISAACERLGIALDRTSVVLDHTGNTSSASVPLALGDALDRGRVSDGDLVLFVGFGAGMTAASAIIRWSTTVNEHQP
ncbi:MAG: beta-ketoacyl-ACP synthase III [Actinomycetota bacterium]